MPKYFLFAQNAESEYVEIHGSGANLLVTPIDRKIGPIRLSAIGEIHTPPGTKLRAFREPVDTDRYLNVMGREPNIIRRGVGDISVPARFIVEGEPTPPYTPPAWMPKGWLWFAGATYYVTKRSPKKDETGRLYAPVPNVVIGVHIDDLSRFPPNAFPTAEQWTGEPIKIK
jgi:hypothetical protein